MEIMNFLKELRRRELEFFGENKLSNSSLIAIARQSVAKNTFNDSSWIYHKMREMRPELVNNATTHLVNFGHRKSFRSPVQINQSA